MSRYFLSRSASAELDAIWDYTADTWGEKLANRYVADIRDACTALSEGRRRGRPVQDLAPYFSLRVGSHLIFYRFDEAGVIDVDRILHQRMDFKTRLTE